MALYSLQAMAYVLSANMDKGVTDYKLEAAISKIFASVRSWAEGESGDERSCSASCCCSLKSSLVRWGGVRKGGTFPD